MHQDIVNAAVNLGVPIDHLRTAANTTEEQISRLRAVIVELWSSYEMGEDTQVNDADLVLHGSLARGELTRQSDADYVILQNGCAPHITQKLLAIAEKAMQELSLSQPGGQRVFGDVVIAANLYERVGLEGDSNQNLTHRMLLLTESASVVAKPTLTGETYDKVLSNTLSRYCADYLPPNREETEPAQVPLHLLNDLVRFWRTMAVDFGAKRWRSARANSQLRLVKLRTTRKMLFAGPLCSLLLAPDRVHVAADLQDYLRTYLSKPPLAQLAGIVVDPVIAPRLLESSRQAVRAVLAGYDELIGIFDMPGFRDSLKDSSPTDRGFEAALGRCGSVADAIEASLETIFFDDPVFSKRVRSHCLF